MSIKALCWDRLYHPLHDFLRKWRTIYFSFSIKTLLKLRLILDSICTFIFSFYLGPEHSRSFLDIEVVIKGQARHAFLVVLFLYSY